MEFVASYTPIVGPACILLTTKLFMQWVLRYRSSIISMSMPYSDFGQQIAFVASIEGFWDIIWKNIGLELKDLGSSLILLWISCGMTWINHSASQASCFHLLRADVRLFFFFKDFIYLFLEGKEGRKRGRETLISCLSHAPNWGPGPQPRHVPWLGIKRDLWVRRPALNPLSHISQGGLHCL